MTLIQLGHKIKNLREKKGLSQVQLAHMVGVTNSLICKIETGQTSGSIHTLKKIANKLDVSVNIFFEDDSSVKVAGE
ncbi:helix-turn-helix domain-containing protein [Desulforamulus reducens]|uniref:helix-turn-helix domain-containing protein n=1 Tax=Desulforamulus reducens TaxID=59610 RepID=UPI003B75CEC9